MVLLVGLSIAGVAQPPAFAGGAPSEATSLLGVELVRAELPADVEASRVEQLADARRAMLRAPNDADAMIWHGRRLAYLGRYRDAIEVYDSGVERFPADARFLRHRGHRWISVRELERAIEDLSRAAELVEGTPDEVEPDGLPNAQGMPRSSLQGNIWYHLALAHYLQGENQRALPAWRRCLELATNDDSRVAASYWLYLTLRRLGLEAESRQVLEAIDGEMDVIENHGYHRLLLIFRGEGETLGTDRARGSEQDPGLRDATEAYGLAMQMCFEGKRERAIQSLYTVLEGQSWAAFGYIAAEADLARIETTRSTPSGSTSQCW